MQVKKVLTKKGREEIYAIIDRVRFDDAAPITPDTVILTIDDKPVGTQNSLVCISGLPKHGKSTFLQIMIATIFLQTDLFNIRMTLPAGRPDILWVDTEHSDFEFKLIVKQIKRLMHKEEWPGNFHAFKCSDLSPEQIPLVIETILDDNPDISVVLLDTMLDLSNNYNDVAEAMSVGRWIKRLKKLHQVLMIGILHLGKKDLNTLGHLGSMVDRWARSVMMVEKTKTGSFTMSCKLQRGAGEFDPITVSYTSDGTIIKSLGNDDQEGRRPEYNPYKSQDGEHRVMIEKVVAGDQVDYKTMFVDLSELTGMSQLQAKKFIKRWLYEGWVYKKGGYYYADNNNKLFKAPLLKSI